jgi:hypothetical protein
MQSDPRERRNWMTRAEIRREAKGVAEGKRVCKNDVVGLAQQLQNLQALGANSPVILNQEQLLDNDGNIKQHLALGLADPFGLQFLKAFAASEGRIVLMDATGGTNTYGYLLYALVGVDEFRSGVPGAFLLTSDQGGDALQQFIEVGAAASN